MNLLQILDVYDNYVYDYGTPAVSSTGGNFMSGLPEALAAFGLLILIIVAVAILCMIANWIVFKKMGIEGWKSLIPGVNKYLEMEATGVNHKWLLIVTYGAILSVIPILGYLVFIVAIIYYNILCCVSLARSFGKSDGFAVGLFFLSPIFLPILAFGSSKYIGKNPMNDVIFKNNNTNVSPNNNTDTYVNSNLNATDNSNVDSQDNNQNM